MNHRQHGDGGFTLVEMTVVLLIFAAVLGIVYPNVSTLFGRPSSANSVRRLMDALTEARAEAIASQHSVRFSLGSDRRTWRYAGRVGGTADGVPLSLSGAPLAGGPAIVFFSDGTSTGGQVTVGEGGGRRVIGVGWLTGKTAEITE